MKKNVKIFYKGKLINREINVIPVRYIFAILLTLLEVFAMIAVCVLLALYVPYFYISLYIVQIGTMIAIVVSNDNPDYKAAWMFFVATLPLVGLVIYLNFHKRTLPKKYIKKYNKIKDSYTFYDTDNFKELKKLNRTFETQAKCLCNISNTHLYKNAEIKYYNLGEKLYKDIIIELKKAEKFIFLEYFIISAGEFWNAVLETLISKAKQGVEIKIVYDDIGCMNTLPGNYYKQLKSFGIDVVLFSKLRGRANGEFNNRSHRKMLIIDGKIAFTGGVNIADEYINKIDRFGHWKDAGIKIKGKAVNEFTKLFLTDFYVNSKNKEIINFNKYYVAQDMVENNSFVIPFGDGPKPIYNYAVSKTAILNLINSACKSVYITTPYIVADNEIMRALENTARRGVDVKIIIPHVADKKMVFGVTKNSCKVLMKSGVKIYEYMPGFIHSKIYIADNEIALVGTFNLDYRSLAHNFENGVWIYNNKVVKDIALDFMQTINKCENLKNKNLKEGLFKRLINILIRLFSPLL